MKLVAIALLVLGLQEKRAVPDDPALKEAEKSVRALFKEEFAKKTLPDKKALAKKLLAQGRETANNAATQHAILTMAIDLAVQTVDVDTASSAMSELSRHFEGDVVAQRTPTLTALGKAVKTPDDVKLLARAYLSLADDAMTDDRYDGAAKAAEAAGAQAKRAKDMGLISAAEAKSKEAAGRKTRFDNVKKAKEVLAAMPDDAAANLEVGKFTCFVKGDWAGGLPLLAKGPDGPLKDVAAKDVANPTKPADRAAVGNAWWDAAEAAVPDEKAVLRERAGHWYQQLPAAEKKKVQPRMEQITLERLSRGSWVDLNDPALFGHAGKFGEPIEITVPKTGRGVSLTSKPFPPGEYDGLQIRVRMKEKGDCGVSFKGPGYTRDVGVAFKPNNGFIIAPGPTWPTGMMWEGVFPLLEEYLITVVHGNKEDVLYLNGRELTRWPNPNDSFDSMRISSDFGTIQFDKIRIRRR
jgi:hypothetical protein